MAKISTWSTTAASNNSAAPDGAPEGMSPASVNDVIRENMSAIAKQYIDQKGTATTGGTTTAYTLTTNNVHTALSEISLFAFQVNAANTGAATLAVDGLTAKAMQLNGAALAAGDLRADEIVLCVYNPDNDVFDIFKSGLNQDTIKTDTINEQTSAQGVTVDGVVLKDSGITATGGGSLTGTWSDLGTVTTVDINGGTIDGTTQATGTINGSIAAGGTWTAAATWTLPALTLGGTVTSNGQSFSGTIADLGTVTTVDINGGTIDGAAIGSGTVNGVIIGGSTPAAGTFTNLTASTDLTLASGATVTAILDEDDMASNSATALITQQSAKAYVDATVVAIGALSVSGTPVANDFARFTGAATIEGRSYAEARADLGLEIGTDVQAEISGASLTTATVATDDKVLIQDTGDSDNLKTVTAQAIADLASSGITRDPRTSNTILGTADSGTLIDVTSGTFTQTITAAATLGDGWFVYYQNSGTGDITLDPNGSETIDGLTSFVMYPGESRLIQCDGSNFNSVVLTSFYKKFTSSDTFTKPPGYKGFGVDAVGAGAGGAAGGVGTEGNGAGGGGGGGRRIMELPESAVSTTETVTIPSGGAGSTTLNGSGADGGTSSFGSLVQAGGGAGGTSGNGGGGGGYFGNASGTTGGGPASVSGFVGAVGSNGNGSPAVWGGGSGSGGQTGGGVAGELGGDSINAAGGGGGGSRNSASSSANGGAGGAHNSYSAGSGVSGGTAAGSGANGGNGTDGADGPAGGGGGGGASAYNGGNAGAGGNGGVPGGGGGGGGGAETGGSFGNGGDGARGEIRVWGIA